MPGKAILLTIMPHAVHRIDQFIEPLNAAMTEFEINTPLRQAAFLAQVAHESGELQYMRELASGDAYEGRHDLGNTQPGDGRKFKGRGPLQVTGRDNYMRCGRVLGLQLLVHPELLELPEYACRSAGWFWTTYKQLNPLADRQAFREITKAINGGYNGWEQRKKYYETAKAVLL